MIINKIGALYKPIQITNNSKLKFNSKMTNDVFIRTTSFNGNEKSHDNKSFDEFKKWAQKSDFLEQIETIAEQTGRILGSGFEGEVIEIPNNENWVIKRFKRTNLAQMPLEKPTINKIDDIAPNINIGQAVAYIRIPVGRNCSKTYYILKKQTGQSLGIDKTCGNEVSEHNNNLHINSLKKLANAPQSAYDKLVKDINYITQQGYMLDYINPNNLMYDNEKQEIHIVDVEDKLYDKTNQYGEMLFCLLDTEYSDRFLISCKEPVKKEEVRQLTENIVNKYFEAMYKNGAKFTKSNIFNLLLESEVLDRNIAGKTVSEKEESLRAMGLYE